YQWWFNGTKLPDGTNASYTIPAIQRSNAGNYGLVVSNSAGSVTSRVVVLAVSTTSYSTTSLAEMAPPVISIQPQGQSVSVGAQATLSATVTGGNLVYQWWFNGTRIPEGTNATWVISSAQSADTGNYAVVVFNDLGRVTSTVVRLTVADAPPVITVQPQSLTVPLGCAAALSATVTGGNLVYQWWFNGVKLPGGTNASYTIPAFQFSNSGNYGLVVSNSAGSLTSRVVALALSA